jgi:DNA-binding NarL/FixJ family response regulator
MRVLLADDQDQVRSALRLVIDQESDLEVIGEVTHPDQLLEKVQEFMPDLLLLDWELLPDRRINLFNTLHQTFPDLYIIAMSACILSEQEALAAGANAFVSKVEPVDRFISSLRNLVHTKNVEIEANHKTITSEMIE